MNQARKRLLILIAVMPIIVLTSASLYRQGMATFEGKERDFWTSLMFATETITTTGYGSEVHWDHPVMVLFVVGLQFIGVVLIYMVVPMFLIPYLEDRFESRLPRRAPKMEGHVVIYRWGAAVETLTAELTQTHTPMVVIEHDESVARRLVARKIPVIFADTTTAAFANVHLEKARAMIANGSDEENASMLLIAQQLEFKGDILALIEEPYHRKPMQLAGATAVYTPRHVLGAALAARASTRISPRVSGIQQLGTKLEVAEIPVSPASAIAGKTLAQAKIGKSTGATVIGQWIKGHLQTQPDGDMRIAPRGILVVVGSGESLGRLTEIASGDRGAVKREGPFIVAGFGEVGRKVHQLLDDAGEKTVVIDVGPGPGVDVAGNVLEPGVLEAAGIADAQAVILALDSDSSTLFATVIIREQAPDVTIIARVNQAENVERLHHAGADFAMSISQVSGQILAHRLLRREAIAIDAQLRVLKSDASRLAGRRPADLKLRQKTGCSVVAVERGEELIVGVGPELRFQAGDLVYVCGSNAATLKFSAEYG